MIVKVFSGIQVGDFVRGHGYRMNPNIAQVWRKVIETSHERIVTVDRRGNERVFTFDLCRQRGLRFKVWTPGDPREDGDNL